jgi:type II secretory ATPase GspE/PulE/Tfp pilus assembly ATPase PilB-like protein
VTPSAAVLGALRARPDFEATLAVLRADGILGGAGDPIEAMRLFRGKGCRHCHGAGFKGRLGIFELYEIGEAARRLIMDRREASALRAEALERGMKTLFQDGLAKALMGQTTVEEVLRVTL